MGEQLAFWELPPQEGVPITFQSSVRPIWTEHKSTLIERYLYYFVLITHHGNYIDGFSGPQQPDDPSMWSAKLVLESEPRWLRKFFLFEKDKRKIDLLDTLKEEQPPPTKGAPRSIEVFPGDFNQRVHEILTPEIIRESEATFCLLDQHTFECHWATVEALARHKKEKSKIELFYFFPQGWFDRALAGQKDLAVLRDWWGNDDWEQLKPLNGQNRAQLICDRLKQELGYQHAYSFPILEKPSGGRVMYYMIHATDHDDAPKLMYRAYRKAIEPKESIEQMELELGVGDSGY